MTSYNKSTDKKEPNQKNMVRSIKWEIGQNIIFNAYSRSSHKTVSFVKEEKIWLQGSIQLIQLFVSISISLNLNLILKLI